MRIKINRIMIIGLSVILIGVFCIMGKQLHPSRLSEKEIWELRKSYPMSEMTCALGQVNVVPLDRLLERGTIQTFVYGEVIGDVMLSSKKFSVGDEVMDTKLEKHGLDFTEYFEYKISVIEDTEEKYQKGDIVTIYSNSIYRDMYPEFSDGMKVIVPLAEGDEGQNRDTYGVVGMYYVTDNDYAISAYDEDEYAMSTYSGLRVNTLLEELKALIE